MGEWSVSRKGDIWRKCLDQSQNKNVQMMEQCFNNNICTVYQKSSSIICIFAISPSLECPMECPVNPALKALWPPLFTWGGCGQRERALQGLPSPASHTPDCVCVCKPWSTVAMDWSQVCWVQTRQWDFIKMCGGSRQSVTLASRPVCIKPHGVKGKSYIWNVSEF